MSGNSRQLAERIAALLRENESDDSAFVRQSLEKINQRLDKIENRFNTTDPRSQIPNPKSFHPSVEKFNVDEVIGERTNGKSGYEKACPYEPTGKPCDHCSMCNSRGF